MKSPQTIKNLFLCVLYVGGSFEGVTIIIFLVLTPVARSNLQWVNSLFKHWGRALLLCVNKAVIICHNQSFSCPALLSVLMFHIWKVFQKVTMLNVLIILCNAEHFLLKGNRKRSVLCRRRTSKLLPYIRRALPYFHTVKEMVMGWSLCRRKQH